MVTWSGQTIRTCLMPALVAVPGFGIGENGRDPGILDSRIDCNLYCKSSVDNDSVIWYVQAGAGRVYIAGGRHCLSCSHLSIDLSLTCRLQPAEGLVLLW